MVATLAGTNAERFAQLVQPEIGFIYRVSQVWAADDIEAQHIAEETMVEALRQIQDFDGQHRRAWLYRITCDVACTRQDMQRLRHRPNPRSDNGVGPSSPRATFDERLYELVSLLPDQYRRVIEAVDVAGLSYRETAHALELPIETVIDRLHRVRAHLVRRQSDQPTDAGVQDGVDGSEPSGGDAERAEDQAVGTAWSTDSLSEASP